MDEDTQQELFNYMHQDHGVLPLEGDIQAIEQIIQRKPRELVQFVAHSDYCCSRKYIGNIKCDCILRDLRRAMGIHDD